MEINITFSRPKRRTLTLMLTITVIAALVWLMIGVRDKSTIPKNISKEMTIKSVYPPKNLLKNGSNSFQYSSEQKALTFRLNFQGVDIVFTEQRAPDNLASGSQVYFQALGLHPTAQFSTKIGPVAIANFYQSGSLEFGGQAAVLVSDGTLVIAKPIDGKTKLTNDQWKILFDSLKLSK